MQVSSGWKIFSFKILLKTSKKRPSSDVIDNFVLSPFEGIQGGEILLGIGKAFY